MTLSFNRPNDSARPAPQSTTRDELVAAVAVAGMPRDGDPWTLPRWADGIITS